MNPAVDMGQIIGGFVMGMGNIRLNYFIDCFKGYHTVEQVIYDTNSISGDLITNSTWEYKVPSHKDIPINFNVTLLKNSFNPLGVLGN
jgi:xanthine dehydrogenase molybdopterin-binding subunit B